MKKIFERYETLFCILLIVLYIVINSFCINEFGITDYRSAIINTLFSIGLIIIIVLLKRVKYYGLTKVKDVKRYLYFFPLIFSMLYFANLYTFSSVINKLT